MLDFFKKCMILLGCLKLLEELYVGITEYNALNGIELDEKDGGDDE